MINFKQSNILDIGVSDYKEFEAYLTKAAADSGGNLTSYDICNNMYLLGGMTDVNDYAELLRSEKIMDPEFRYYLERASTHFSDGQHFDLFEFFESVLFSSYRYNAFKKYEFFDYSRVYDLIVEGACRIYDLDQANSKFILSNKYGASNSFYNVSINLLKFTNPDTIPFINLGDKSESRYTKYFSVAERGFHGDRNKYAAKDEFALYMLVKILYSAGVIDNVLYDERILKAFYKYESDINVFVNIFSKKFLSEEQLANTMPKMFFNEEIPVDEREAVLKKYYKVKNLFRYTDSLATCSFETFEAFMNVTIFGNNRLRDKNIGIAELVYRVFFNVRNKESKVTAVSRALVEKYHMEIFDGIFKQTQNLNICQKFSLNIKDEIIKSDLYEVLMEQPCFRKEHIRTFSNCKRLMSEFFFSAYAMDVASEDNKSSYLKSSFAFYFYGTNWKDAKEIIEYKDIEETFDFIVNAHTFTDTPCFNVMNGVSSTTNVWALISNLCVCDDHRIKLFNKYLECIANSDILVNHCFNPKSETATYFNASKYACNKPLPSMCSLWFIMYKLSEKYPAKVEFEFAFNNFLDELVTALFETQQKNVNKYKKAIDTNNSYELTVSYESHKNSFPLPFMFIDRSADIGDAYQHPFFNLKSEYLEFVTNIVVKRIYDKIYNGVYEENNIVTQVADAIMNLASLENAARKLNGTPKYGMSSYSDYFKKTIIANIEFLREWNNYPLFMTNLSNNESFKEMQSSIEDKKDELEQQIQKYITEPLEFLYSFKTL